MGEKKSQIVQIGSGTIARAVLILIFFFFLYQISDLVLIVLTAIVIAAAVEPMIKFLARYGIARLFGVLITYLVAIFFIGGVIYFFLPPLLADFSGFLSSAPSILEGANSLWRPISGQGSGEAFSALSNRVSASKDFIDLLSFESLFADSAVTNLVAKPAPLDLINQFRAALSSASESLIKVVSLAFGGLFSFLLIVVLSFYLAVQEDGIGSFLRIVTPVRYEAYLISLWDRAREKIGLWIQGQLLLAVLVGVLVYLGLMVLGVKNALFFAFLAAVFELIPVFGPILSAIPPIALSFIDGGLTAALLVAGLFLIIQQFENHLIYPLVVRKIVGVPPIMVILAIIIGGKLAGFLGIILAVPVATVILEYFHDMEKQKLNAAGASPK
jgi:predicted PurR-regulated permease PerM